MKKKLNVLISSLVAISMSASLATGATYALFTSESTVNVAVTSGKVSVTATVDESSLTTYSNEVKQDFGKFENGGTATYDEETATLTLDRMCPLDSVAFNIKVTNNSNVAIQYRVSWSVEGELAEALVATADDEPIVDGVSAWTPWTVSEANTKTIAVKVAFPDADDNNGYMEKAANVTFSVVAVQGNGTVANVKSADALSAALVNEKVEKVVLSNDITLAAGNFTFAAGAPKTIDLGGNDLTVTNTDATPAFLMNGGDLTITGEGNVAVQQINNSEGATLTIGEGVKISTSNAFAINNSGTTVLDGATINHTGTNHAIQNSGTLIINDATVTSTSDSNINTINSQNGTVIINGGTFTHEGSMGSVIKWLYSNEGEIVINGGTFIQKGGDSLASIDYGDAKLTINGGTFDSASYFAQPARNIVINAGEFKNNAVVVFNPFTYWTIADKYIPATSTATTNADGSITVTVNE